MSSSHGMVEGQMTFSDEDLKRLKERFLAKTNKTDGCWLWVGATGSNGYGQMQFGPRKQQAHRISYQLFVGPIPENLTLDHICRIRNCVNPYHVRPMTMIENSRIGNRFTARPKCHKGHAYTPENTKLYRGYRVCRRCKREKDARLRIKYLEQYNERSRLRYSVNKVAILAKQKEYYEKNRENILAKQMCYQRLRTVGK